MKVVKMPVLEQSRAAPVMDRGDERGRWFAVRREEGNPRERTWGLGAVYLQLETPREAERCPSPQQDMSVSCACGCGTSCGKGAFQV